MTVLLGQLLSHLVHSHLGKITDMFMAEKLLPLRDQASELIISNFGIGKIVT